MRIARVDRRHGEVRMEIHNVEISITLLGKIKKWGEGDQIILSAFVQCLREFEVISVLGGFNCLVENTSFGSKDFLKIVIFWMSLRGTYIRLILREVAEHYFVVSDR
jgi:hypothetical protein